jgi:hypothetical protein
MYTSSPTRLALPAVVAAALLLLTAGGATASSSGHAATARASQSDPTAGLPCAPLRGFFPGHHFPAPTTINNTYFPLVPGTQFVLEGRANRGGAALPHRVTFTVTDLTKVIRGVRTLAVWDVDEDGGQVVEAELAFFAQDDRGNVWTMGEYPEEYEDGTFVGASSTWFAGLEGAIPGVLVPGKPRVQRAGRFFIEGLAPSVDFLDCAMVPSAKKVKRNLHVCVPAGCFDNVLTINETSPLEPDGGIQVKYYAPGVGNVQVAAVNDPEGETLVLTALNHLAPDGLVAARAEALKLEQHAYEVSKVYRRTPPMVMLGA